jgi:peptidoglycan/LPS O-acetylase OafA/YrhL
MTYPLYLVHAVVGESIVRYLISVGMEKWAALTFGVVSMIFLSWVICNVFEPLVRERLTAAIDRIASQRRFRAEAVDKI